MKWMWWVAALLLAGCLVGVAWFTVEHSRALQPAPQVLGLANEFEGDLQLSAAEVKQHFEIARQHMLSMNSAGNRLRLVADLANLAAFVLTSTVSLILGYFGLKDARPVAPAPNTNNVPGNVARAVGVLAALAAVCTAGSSLAGTKGQEYYKCSDEIRTLVSTSRVKVLQAKTREEAQGVLDELDVGSQRCARA